MVRLIAADMDGTLLDENSLLPKETFELIEALRDRGVLFCASSGRRYETLRWLFEPVADRIDYVASLGTQVYADGQLLDREVFSTRAVLRLFRTCQEFDCFHLVLYDRTHTFLLDDQSSYVRELDKDLPNAERVFDPAIYSIEIEQRVGTGRKGECGGSDRAGLTVNAQRTGFAIRKGIAFDRLADFTEVQVGNPDLRSGVDVVVRPARGTPIRLLSVHLKAGCSSGDRNDACPVLFQQVPVMERWIDARASEGTRFAVLGDFNRRLVMPADTVWAEWDDASPANADLARASGDQSARCNPRYKDFIDYIVLDRRAAAGLVAFDEKTYTADALSDHCAIAARLQAN